MRYPTDGHNPGPADYTYTGQYSNMDDFGLMYYNARWYDPYLNRWTQPDTIVPDPYDTQVFDRYAYALDNPVRYSDPSGHYVCQDTGQCTPSESGDRGSQRTRDTDTDHDGVPNVPDPSYPAIQMGRHLSYDCLPGNLVECFYDRGVMPPGDFDITAEEYYSLMLAVSYDIDNQGPISNYDTRGIYDTPFYDLGNLEGTICVGGSNCRSRMEYNYIAQGEWSAAALEGPEGMVAVVVGWKQHEYHTMPTPGVLASASEGFAVYAGLHPAQSQVMLYGIRNYLSGATAFLRYR